MLREITELAKQYQIEKMFNVCEKFMISRIKQGQQIQNYTYFDYSGDVGNDINDQKMRAFQTRLKDIAQYKNIKHSLRFRRRLQVGERFPKFGRMINSQTGKQQELQIQQDQVTIVIYYDFRNWRSIELLQQLQYMLEKNKEKWGKKVRIICISFEADTNKKKILGQHYISQKNNSQYSLDKILGVVYLPFICFIDKKGINSFSDNIEKIYFRKQDKINELLFGQGQGEKQTKKLVKMSTIENIQTLFQGSQFKKYLEKSQNLKIEVTGRLVYLHGQLAQSNCQIQLKYSIKDKIFIDWAKQKIGDFTNVEISQSIREEISVPKGQKCSQCSQLLGQFYYWCFWSGSQDLRCRRCVEATNERGLYIYPNNSILLHKTTKTVKRDRLGNNLQPKNQVGARIPNDYQCNGCWSCPQEQTCRYISLGSRNEREVQTNGYHDLCQPCMIKYINGDKKIRQEVPSQNPSFLRVLYGSSGFSYWNY